LTFESTRNANVKFALPGNVNMTLADEASSTVKLSTPACGGGERPPGCW
jgi:hypothetical protein